MVEVGDRVEVHTATPTAVTRALTAWAQEAGVDELPGLRIDRATLEDIYLRLIAEHDRSGGLIPVLPVTPDSKGARS